MFSRSIILFPLLLVSLCRAEEDACPAGYAEVVSTITSEVVAVQIPTPTSTTSVEQLSSSQPASMTTPGSTTVVPDLAVSAVNEQSSTMPNPVQTSATFITSVVKQSSPTATSALIAISSLTPSATISSTSVSGLTQTTSSSAATETFIGLGTRYGGSCTEEDCWQNGACSFVDYTLPAGVDGSTCVSSDIWNNGANCGGCISVTYKGKTITVMVTNETGGNATHLDMTPATWTKLTNGYSGGGVNDIEWEWVTCPIAEATPLSIRMHGGASMYWFAATVENARLRTAKLEVSSDSGKTWTAAVLDNYNIWTLGKTLPSNTAWVRVTSVNGDQVVVENVALKSGVVTDAAENY